MKRKVGISFMVSGILLLVAAAGILLYNTYENKRAEEQSGALVGSLIDIANNQSDTEKDPFDTEMKVAQIDGYGYIGYLMIPELGLELPVMSEWSYPRLKISPCRYYGSAKTDNLVIAAHNFRSHFGYIGKLTQGSQVLLADMEGNNYTYTVTSIDILQPTDVDKVKDTGDDLILYTCTYGGRTRVVVRCERTE